MELFIALISAGLGAIVTYLLTLRREALAERKKIYLEYLSPLRLYLTEDYFRLNEILRKVESEGKSDALTCVNDAKEISSKDGDWFNGQGCYLISSSYILLACFITLKESVRISLISNYEVTIIQSF